VNSPKARKHESLPIRRSSVPSCLRLLPGGTVASLRSLFADNENQKKQKAHEVTRDVTAWAFAVSDRFCEQSASGLGPPRSAQPSPCFSTGTRQTVDRDSSAAIAHPMGWHGGFPTGRPWGFAFPDPVPRIDRSHSPLPDYWDWSGSDASDIGELSSRGSRHHVRRR